MAKSPGLASESAPQGGDRRSRRERARHGGGSRHLCSLRPSLARHLRGDPADARRNAGAPARVCRSQPALSGRRSGNGNLGLRLRGRLSPAAGLSLHHRGFGLCRRRPRRPRHRLGAAWRTDRRCERGPWRQMVAIVGDSANSGSIALHRRFGFELVGTLRSVGFKLGRWVDTPILQRALGTARR